MHGGLELVRDAGAKFANTEFHPSDEDRVETTTHWKVEGLHKYSCERWIRRQRIGKGGQGSVFLECLDENEAIKRAVKRIDVSDEDVKREYYTRELEALAKFSRETYRDWFVRSYGWYETGRSLYIPMEYFPLGDLKGYIRDHGAIKESEAKHIAWQIVHALKLMHQEGFAHRDIKPDNILIQREPSHGGEWKIKVTDMGISKRINELDGSTTSVKFTPNYRAPELMFITDETEARAIKAEPYPVDIWCFGETLHYILTKKHTFSGPTRASQCKKYYNGRIPFPRETLRETYISPDMIDFLLMLMQPQPKNRLSSLAAEIWLEGQQGDGRHAVRQKLSEQPTIFSKPGASFDTGKLMESYEEDSEPLKSPPEQIFRPHSDPPPTHRLYEPPEYFPVKMVDGPYFPRYSRALDPPNSLRPNWNQHDHQAAAMEGEDMMDLSSSHESQLSGGEIGSWTKTESVQAQPAESHGADRPFGFNPKRYRSAQQSAAQLRPSMPWHSQATSYNPSNFLESNRTGPNLTRSDVFTTPAANADSGDLGLWPPQAHLETSREKGSASEQTTKFPYGSQSHESLNATRHHDSNTSELKAPVSFTYSTEDVQRALEHHERDRDEATLRFQQRGFAHMETYDPLKRKPQPLFSLYDPRVYEISIREDVPLEMALIALKEANGNRIKARISLRGWRRNLELTARPQASHEMAHRSKDTLRLKQSGLPAEDLAEQSTAFQVQHDREVGRRVTEAVEYHVGQKNDDGTYTMSFGEGLTLRTSDPSQVKVHYDKPMRPPRGPEVLPGGHSLSSPAIVQKSYPRDWTPADTYQEPGHSAREPLALPGTYERTAQPAQPRSRIPRSGAHKGNQQQPHRGDMMRSPMDGGGPWAPASPPRQQKTPAENTDSGRQLTREEKINQIHQIKHEGRIMDVMGSFEKHRQEEDDYLRELSKREKDAQQTWF